MYISLIGPPASGKGTQARFLAEKHGFKIISISGMIKEQINLDPDFKATAQKFLDENPGHLLPDEIILPKVKEMVAALPKNVDIIFDGFPRTLSQAQAFDDILKEQDKMLDYGLELTFYPEDKEMLVERQRRRAEDAVAAGETPRKDDLDPEVTKKRVDIFWDETYPVLDYYRGAHRLYQVDGKAGIDKVAEQISMCIENMRADRITPPMPLSWNLPGLGFPHI